MTKLSRPIRRAIDGVTARGIVVTLYPNRTIGLRESRTRREHVVTLARVFRLAVEVSIEADEQLKRARKNAKRAERGLAPIPMLARRGKL